MGRVVTAVEGVPMMLITIRRWYYRFTRLDVQEVVVEQDKRRALLDERLSKLTKAALNGDEDWFMGAVNPTKEDGGDV